MPDLTGWPPRFIGTAFKHQAVPGVVARATRKKDKQERLDEAYAVVNTRDRGRCRVTGVSLVAGAPDPKVRREHHHLAKRSTHRTLRHSARNIVLVSAFAHQLIERGWLVAEGRNADKPIIWHWSEIATSHPLKITRSLSRDQAVRERD